MGVYSIAIVLLGNGIGNDAGDLGAIMGKTSKPIKLFVQPMLWGQNPKLWVDLQAQGHKIEVHLLPDNTHILGPNCWRMLDLEYLDVTIAAIRKETYAIKDDTANPTTKVRKTKHAQGSD